jgi:hypothetical protein
MATGRLIAGNVANLLIAILAFLQVLPWQIAGYLIIGTVLVVTLSHLNSRKQANEESLAKTLASETVAGRALVKSDAFSDRPNVHVARAKDVPHELPTAAEKSISPKEQAAETGPSDSPSAIPEGDFLSFDVTLEKGEELVGEVSSNGQVNVYILNEENLTALDSDQEFWYEAGTEGVKDAVLRFTASEDGDWFFVVENVDAREISAKAKVTVTKAAHSVPLLKAEGFGLPDARLEGKLQP